MHRGTGLRKSTGQAPDPSPDPRSIRRPLRAPAAPAVPVVPVVPAAVASASNTVTPRYRQARQREDGKQVFYASEPAERSSPTLPQPPRPTNAPRRVASRSSTPGVGSDTPLSSSSPVEQPSSTALRTTSRVSTFGVPAKPVPSKTGPDPSANLKIGAALGSSKFVYANGEEEVLSPRRPTVSATTSSSALSPPLYFRSASPTLSPSSASSEVSEAEAGSDSEDDDALQETNAARTNRKILDLEISNTSLLEINRTLERQVRGQSRELRAFKRWIQQHNVSGIDADDDDDQDREDATLGNARSALAGGVKSLDGAHSDEFARSEEEWLASTQALNTSITKCIFMSDMLIKIAKGSLDSKITDEDLLGGRVLSYDDATRAYDEDEDEDEEGESDEDGNDATIRF